MEEKPCFLCKQPLHKILIGPKRFPYFVHRGTELGACAAIHPPQASLKILKRSMEYMMKKQETFRLHYHPDGRVKIHGEQLRTDKKTSV
jgi:hypothetical protein